MNNLNLEVKTKNNTSPINKTRIFISHAWQDKELMLSKIKYLLSLYDCAIYYIDHDLYKDIDPIEAQSLIDNMDVYIPIITSHYLDDSCFEFKHLFPLMKKRRNNLMPLIQEKELYEVFNEKCGHIQFLEDNDNNNYHISLEDKIRKYFDNLGQNDKLIKMVKKEFVNKIFISYRKIDKPLIKPVLDKINSSMHTLYDVGIWYDENLTIGQKYDPEINNQIKSANIFLLLVSNNIFEKGNYVLTEELPLAMELHKAIIPIKIADYDKDKYKETFPDLEEPIEIDNIIEEIAKYLKPVTRGPKHDNLIGIGYLYGYSVLKDSIKAKDIFLRNHKDVANAESLVIYYENYEPDEIERLVRYSSTVCYYDIEHHPDELHYSIIKHIFLLSKLVESGKSKQFDKDNLRDLVLYCVRYANRHEIEPDVAAIIAKAAVIANNALGLKESNVGLFKKIQETTSTPLRLMESYLGEIKEYLDNNDIENAKTTIDRFLDYLSKYKLDDAYNFISNGDFSFFSEIYFAARQIDHYESPLWDKYLSLMYERIDDENIQFPFILSILNECNKILPIVRGDRKAWPEGIIHRIGVLNEKIEKITTEKEETFRSRVYICQFVILVSANFIMQDIDKQVDYLKNTYGTIKYEDTNEMILLALEWAVQYYNLNYEYIKALETNEFICDKRNNI